MINFENEILLISFIPSFSGCSYFCPPKFDLRLLIVFINDDEISVVVSLLFLQLLLATCVFYQNVKRLCRGYVLEITLFGEKPSWFNIARRKYNIGSKHLSSIYTTIEQSVPNLILSWNGLTLPLLVVFNVYYVKQFLTKKIHLRKIKSNWGVPPQLKKTDKWWT